MKIMVLSSALTWLSSANVACQKNIVCKIIKLEASKILKKWVLEL